MVGIETSDGKLVFDPKERSITLIVMHEGIEISAKIKNVPLSLIKLAKARLGGMD